MSSPATCEIVREQEAGAIGGEIDRGDPLLQIERAAAGQELGDEAREPLARRARRWRARAPRGSRASGSRARAESGTAARSA